MYTQQIALAVFQIFNFTKDSKHMMRASIRSAQLITVTSKTFSLCHHIGVLVFVYKSMCVFVSQCVFLTSYLLYDSPPESDHVHSVFGFCIEALQGSGTSRPPGVHRNTHLLNLPKGGNCERRDEKRGRGGGSRKERE